MFWVVPFTVQQLSGLLRWVVAFRACIPRLFLASANRHVACVKDTRERERSGEVLRIVRRVSDCTDTAVMDGVSCPPLAAIGQRRNTTLYHTPWCPVHVAVAVTVVSAVYSAFTPENDSPHFCGGSSNGHQAAWRPFRTAGSPLFCVCRFSLPQSSGSSSSAGTSLCLLADSQPTKTGFTSTTGRALARQW